MSDTELDEDRRQDQDVLGWRFTRALNEFEKELQQAMKVDTNGEGSFTRAYVRLLPTPLVKMLQTSDWDNADLPTVWREWLDEQLSKYPMDRSAHFSFARCVAEGLALRDAIGFEVEFKKNVSDRLTEIVASPQN